MKKTVSIYLVFLLTMLSACATPENNETPKIQGGLEGTKMTYTMPAEELPHDDTWLTWPHRYTYGIEYQNEIEHIWLEITQALRPNERVHIIAYDDENDDITLAMIAELYPERKIVPIIVNSLFQYGGMLHCVTQQQPINKE